MTENSASLTWCNRLTCKGDGKLFRHEDQINPTSSDDEGGIFRKHRNFPTVFCSHANEFSDNFPSTFDEKSIKSSATGIWSQDLQGYNLLLYHCATLSLCLYVWQDPLFLAQYMFTFVSTVFSFVSTVLTFVSTVFSFLYSVHLRQYCVFLLQYCVNLRHTVFFIVRSLFIFVSTLFFFLSMVLNFVSICFLCQYSVHLRQYCVFLRQYCVYLRQYCVFSWTQCWIFQQSMGAQNRVEIVFVNVYEAQDSIPRNLFRQAGNRFLGF